MAFPADFSYRVAITIESDDVDADLTNWTLVFDQSFDSVLTSVNGPLDADGTRASLNGGGDIRFSSDEAGTSRLACDIRTWATNNTPASATCEAAVLIPSVSSSGDTTIYMWWGSAGETQPVASDTYGQYNAYDSDYLAVIPMTETSTDWDDRTSNGYDAVWDNDAASASGAVGNCGDFNDGDTTTGADDSGILGDIAALELETFTVEVLAYRRAQTLGMGMWGLQAEIASGDTGVIFNTENPGDQFQMSFSISGSFSQHQASTAPNDDTWYHTGTKKSGTAATLMVNGATTGLGTTAVLSSSTIDYTPVTSQRTSVGGYWSGTHSEGIYGADALLDEFRISDVARSDAWLAANYHNQLNTSGFLTWGSIEEPSSGVTVTPNVGTLTIEGHDPTVGFTQDISPNLGTVSVTGYNPTVSVTQAIAASAVGALTVEGHNPTVTFVQAVTPNVGTTVIRGFKTTITAVGGAIAGGITNIVMKMTTLLRR